MTKVIQLISIFRDHIPNFIWLQKDVMAGLAVAVMVVPQGMSYAQNLVRLPTILCPGPDLRFTTVAAAATALIKTSSC